MAKREKGKEYSILGKRAKGCFPISTKVGTLQEYTGKEATPPTRRKPFEDGGYTVGSTLFLKKIIQNSE
ncbi:hypothetical protein POVCU2_0045970 [Plasmodium ovale curtisi]|uniref:Uncharacterized protein n=1 Tax=Plasmodium ovale curtisi TaxID=864141 RepID=A0A1A8X2K4_PLAOA|nr:hypothetical protein POVCU2_0045970 [Plasmodium ovale curtisi]SBS97968.1 hypothetical protein POVCU1_042420 [Plasmodium ovale curtisi]